MGFSRQEHWVGCHALLQGNLPDPGIEPRSLMSPALTGGFLPPATWEGLVNLCYGVNPSYGSTVGAESLDKSELLSWAICCSTTYAKMITLYI